MRGASRASLAEAKQRLGEVLDGDADAGLVAYEMTVLVKRVGQHLAANSRVPGQQPTR